MPERARRREGPVAVVTELGIAGLSVVRSLGKRGVRVIGIDSKLTNHAARSKYCEVVRCKSVNDESLVLSLLDVGRKLKEKGVLFCASDMSVSIVSQHRGELEKFYRFVLPPADVIETLLNKRLFHEFAVLHNLCVPNTLFTCNRHEVEQAAENLSFPCVVKPEMRDESWYAKVDTSEKVFLARSIDDFFSIFDRYDVTELPLIIQEWIHGDDGDVYFCLTYIGEDGEPKGVFTGRKIRQYPLLTGVTSAAVSLREVGVEDEALRLLRLSGCVGLCSVEFKFCRRDGVYKITEPTVGRPDLQEEVSVVSGMDLPGIAYSDAIGEKTTRRTGFREGMKWFCEPHELYSIPECIRRDVYGVRGLLASYRGKRHFGLMHRDDPYPFLGFALETIRRKVKRAIRGKTA